MLAISPLMAGWILDLLIGDPQWLPHPVVWFGKAIAACEHKLNRGHHRIAKGAVVAILLIALVFALTWLVRYWLLPLSSYLLLLFDAVIIFYCLAGTTLIREVHEVFYALDRSLEEGRQQVARIVGRDTSELSAQEVRTAALETLAENLSDGVIAPLFWFALSFWMTITGRVPVCSCPILPDRSAVYGYSSFQKRFQFFDPPHPLCNFLRDIFGIEFKEI